MKEIVGYREIRKETPTPLQLQTDNLLGNLLLGKDVDTDGFLSFYDTGAGIDSISSDKTPHTFGGLSFDFSMISPSDNINSFSKAIDAFSNDILGEEEQESEIPFTLGSEGNIVDFTKKKKQKKIKLDDFDRVKTQLKEYKEQYGSRYDLLWGGVMSRATQLHAMCAPVDHGASSAGNLQTGLLNLGTEGESGKHEHCKFCIKGEVKKGKCESCFAIAKVA